MPILNRECTKTYEIPGTNVIVEKGIQVVIPTMGMHYDPQYFPEPEKFDPERFSEEAKNKRHQYVYLPFGEGPRICIGNKTLYIIIHTLQFISFLYIPHITQSNNTIIQRLRPATYSYVVVSKITNDDSFLLRWKHKVKFKGILNFLVVFHPTYTLLSKKIYGKEPV